MKESEIFLVSLRPPSNIERKLIDLQRTLFREYGLASALALTPRIPLAFFTSPPSKPRPVRHAAHLETGALVGKGHLLVLAAEPSTWLGELAAAITRDGQPASGPFPSGAGVYLADCAPPPLRAAGEPVTPAAAELAAGIAPPQRLRWATGRLECIRLRFADPECWWCQVESEELWTLRMPRAENPGGATIPVSEPGIPPR